MCDEDWLVVDYTGKEFGEEPEMQRIGSTENLLRVLDVAKTENRKVTVYKIRWVLDWS